MMKEKDYENMTKEEIMKEFALDPSLDEGDIVDEDDLYSPEEVEQHLVAE